MVGGRCPTLPFQRKPEREGRPDAQLAPEVEGATQQLGQAERDGQPEAGPCPLPGHDLLELLEDPGAVVGSDARPGVRDADLQLLATGPLIVVGEPDLDGADIQRL